MTTTILIQGGYVLRFEKGSSPTNPLLNFKEQDVLIRGNKIVQIGKGIVPPVGATVIDASNHIVSPGFVDTHRHL